jgi:hypothetical protein
MNSNIPEIRSSSESIRDRRDDRASYQNYYREPNVARRPTARLSLVAKILIGAALLLFGVLHFIGFATIEAAVKVSSPVVATHTRAAD